MLKQLKKINFAGLVMSGPGASGHIDGPLEVFLAALVGALGGFISGMLAGIIARLCTLNRVKGIIGDKHWGVYGAGVGALTLALIEIFD